MTAYGYHSFPRQSQEAQKAKAQRKKQIEEIRRQRRVIYQLMRKMQTTP